MTLYVRYGIPIRDIAHSIYVFLQCVAQITGQILSFYIWPTAIHTPEVGLKV